ncbi:hypothetical protein EIN_375610 [Entamoeba invadens IP1]|uniref:Uncharacterized protein n=1 Tax=Entamoeba invadens IP1 TaxID=370355 RepID=A0A0A1TY63_ENTIV|nr:hypothetical protein EIN_375610 [Entamoeba invadens IP1]ELP83446.1 hypothetical protein EIN_375610 [Entamoeba invadens IP1]|eukprot:XP_004182792.1 hypothetical protein EIN_375610 [Entamoeba invadens IP1]
MKSLTEIKRESKTYEAIQQALMVGLLTEAGFSFDLKCPERLASKTLQNLVILECYFQGNPLGFGQKIEEYCASQYLRDSEGAKTQNEIKVAKRRKDLNRSALSFNWLVKYVEQYGYILTRRPTKIPKKTLQMEKITGIGTDHECIFNEDAIEQIGRKIHVHILSEFQRHMSSFRLKEYDEFCQLTLQTKNRLVKLEERSMK